jgi:hypothetical protein
LDDHSRELVARVIRLALAGVPHRLVSRFDFLNGQLGVAVSLERKRTGRWIATRTETWLPLAAQTKAVYETLLHVAEHGRLPALADTATESRR